MVRAVGTSLIQAKRYGTAVSQALRVLAKESRDMRVAEAEKKAAALTRSSPCRWSYSSC